jgi:D-serine deaminase-like pyridoxal phosphate-dependent protein
MSRSGPGQGRSTPYLLVDVDVLADNIARMAARARRRRVALRPHAKTHKCLEIARMQVDAGAVGLTVATVSEAEVFASGGFTDLFVAYPLWVDVDRGTRLRALAERAAVVVGVDSADGARALAAQAPGTAVMVEVDSGQHRSGVAPAEAGVVAEASARAGLDVRGVFTFPGHSYAPGVRADVRVQEADTLRRAVASLSARGLEAAVVSGGSTPTATLDAPADGAADGVADGVADGDGVLDELRPGVYVFSDAQQWELGASGPENLALTCVATVVSRADGRVVLDAGSKALGADRSDWATGYGRLLDHPDARITALSEHHAVVTWNSSPGPEPGSRVRVVPNHACNAVNLHDELVLTDGSVWPVAARGALT